MDHEFRNSAIGPVVHEWAHAQEPDAKYDSGKTYNNNVWWQGPVIYSYGHHFPMARIVDGIVMITTRGYSSSSTNHLNEVRRATSHMRKVRCYDPEQPFSSAAIFDTLNTVEGLLFKAGEPRRRQATREGAVAEAERQWQQWLDLVAFDKKIGRKRPWYKMTPSKEQASRLRKIPKLIEAAKVDAVANRAKMSEAQRKDEAKREKAKQKEQDDLRRRVAQQKAEIKAEMEKGYPAWLNGEGPAHFHLHRHSFREIMDFDGLRLAARDDEVETTAGLTVPAEDCRKIWPLLERLYRSRYCGALPERARLGSFNANAIMPNGELMVGCHRFRKEDIFALAQRLGLTNAAV